MNNHGAEVQSHPLVQLVDKKGVEEVALGEASQLAHLYIPLLIYSTSIC